jgi:hypothetical protein
MEERGKSIHNFAPVHPSTHEYMTQMNQITTVGAYAYAHSKRMF